ncbi:DUF6000 family protein [Streptomyces resistomycificus]|uniref:Uncharacterized protein n=1 Tax=Streptomyces resistomycificus TaxID=67356 RepID=A0A0L8KT55_9ACTN|nr:DUF6000 family protein [Streptomyces resistomycificus]KOG28919.1 hypothetical protein ADK37_38300 [Streptomyces resistomycificus]KUN94338.1 hypothetical protein AQJ84_27025 [Streptomyces resistomycificus]
MIRHPHDDAELSALVRRYVTPDRRYLKLGGGLLRMQSPEYESPDDDRFMRDLREDAGLITADEIATLLEGGWRERRTAAWFVAVSRRTGFRERLGELLLASETCCVGLAYSVALASFGTARDADLLAAYLDRYLRRPDLAYDQTVVMGALRFIDLNLGGDQADRFLGPGGLWQQWLQDASHMEPNTDPTPSYLSLIRRLCAFVDECAEVG